MTLESYCPALREVAVRTALISETPVQPCDISDLLQEGKGPRKVLKTLQKMEANPKDNWRIDQVQSVAKALGIDHTPPKGTSHCVFTSKHLDGHANVPARRPIKPFYIATFVSFCKAHLALEHELDRKSDQ